MNSSAVQLNLRFLRHSAGGERIYLRFIPGKRHFCVDCLARFAVSKAVFSVDIRQQSHRRHRLRQRLYIRACRGKVDGKHLYNFILLYDCKTLKYAGIYYDMSSEYLTDGIPWCAIDRENGYLYTSQFHNVGEILQYDLETMTFLRAIPLEEKLDRIQGGSVRVEFTRYCPNYDNEAEDVCVYPMEDGSLFHVVDYDKLINANVSHYKPAEG